MDSKFKRDNKVKRIEQYQCDFCKKIYDNVTDAINCECEHLGLSNEEYDEYKKLLREESYAYEKVSITRNDKTIQVCDDATKKVLAFKKLHHIPENIDIRVW